MQKLLQSLQKLSNWYLVSLLLFFILFSNIVIIPASGIGLEEMARTPLDLHFGFSHSEVSVFAETIGPPGREQYISGLQRVDFIYPVIYSFFFLFLFLQLSKKSLNVPGIILPIFFLPMLFDYGENIGICNMMRSFPAIDETILVLSSVSNQLKWLTIGTIVILLIVQAIRFFFSGRTEANK
jgi:hypothetical protein